MPNPSSDSSTPDELKQTESSQSTDTPDDRPWWEVFSNKMREHLAYQNGFRTQRQSHATTQSVDGHSENCSWDPDGGVLRIGRETVALFPKGKRRAPEQEAILDAFQRAGWPEILEVQDVDYMNVSRLNKRIAKLSNFPLVFRVQNGRKEVIRSRC
jgi:hypothetical protein